MHVRVGFDEETFPAGDAGEVHAVPLAAALDPELDEVPVLSADPGQDLREHSVLAVLTEAAQLVFLETVCPRVGAGSDANLHVRAVKCRHGRKSRSIRNQRAGLELPQMD